MCRRPLTRSEVMTADNPETARMCIGGAEAGRAQHLPDRRSELAQGSRNLSGDGLLLP